MNNPSILYLYVTNSGNMPVTDANIEISNIETGKKYEMMEISSGQYQNRKLITGNYEIKVFTVEKKNLQPEIRKVILTSGNNYIYVILGEKDESAYYAGDERIYFREDNHSFLITTRGRNAVRKTQIILKDHKLKINEFPIILDKRSETPPYSKAISDEPSDSYFVEVELPDNQTVEQAGELMTSISDELQNEQLFVILALIINRGKNIVLGLTNELVIRFEESVTKKEAELIAKKNGLVIIRPILYAGNSYLVFRPGPPSYNILKVAETLRKEFPVKYAEPNLLQQIESDQYTPNDLLWNNLTYLRFINCDDAWETLEGINPSIKGGSSNITIAVFDKSGVTPDHPDLTGNLTDGTSKLVISFNFVTMSLQTAAGLGDPVTPNHGTQCAGSTTAKMDNNLGIVGVAPNCHLIGGRIPSPATGMHIADALIWAAGFNPGWVADGTNYPTGTVFPSMSIPPADIISNSWGQNNAPLSSLMRDCFDFLTVYGRKGRGCIVVFSVGNLGYVQFSSTRRYAAYERTIAVGASISTNPTSPVNSHHPDPNGNTNNITAIPDTRALYSPYGPEMDIVAPSSTSFPTANTFTDPITSAVRSGTGNVNGCTGSPCFDYGLSSTDPCGFGGTSHACPSIAGTAALILSVNPSLSWIEVREILRATAIRIDSSNTNPIGQWVDNDGDGVNEFSQWYGYGRVDVNAAVVATRDIANAADIVVRENLSDNGDVPSTGWHAESPDIWVRRTDDPIPVLPYASSPPHQDPKRGQDNYLFCRIKNRGTATSNEVYVRAMITHFPGLEFRYPQDFIPSNRPGEPVPNPLVRGTYLIAEVKVNNLTPGNDQIVKMRWPQALIPPDTVIENGINVQWHPCLLLEASPHDGPLPSGATFDIKRDNNIAQRNISILDASDPVSDLFTYVVLGTLHSSGLKSLIIDRSLLKDDAKVLIYILQSNIMQELISYAKKRIYNDTIPILKIEKYQGIEVVEILHSKNVLEIPISLAGNKLTPLLVAVPHSGYIRNGELRLTQRRGDGELSSGYSLVT